MKKFFLNMIAAAMVIFVGVASSYGQNMMTMTTKAIELRFVMYGTGKATIDWGDKEKETCFLKEKPVIKDSGSHGAFINKIYSHRYFFYASSHIIKITGDNVTNLDCSKNRLISLDVSKNTALTELKCNDNQLTAAALNSLFNTLHDNAIEGVKKTIIIGGNPGTNTCDRSIAESKGWIVQ